MIFIPMRKQPILWPAQNAERLNQAISEVEAGKVVQHALIDE